MVPVPPEPSRLRALLPRASLLPNAADYRRLPQTWRRDLLAGLTVGIVALPLALAFAISSGLSAEAGLVTAIVAGLIAAVFGGSHVQVSGPTGAMVVVLAPIAAAHGPAAIPVVALMAGALVVLAGLLRLGRSVAFIPFPVIEGFTLGIATIIFFQQIPAALGSDTGQSRNAVVHAVQAAAGASWPQLGWTLGTAGLVIGIMLLAPLIHPQLPGSIIAIIVAALLAAWLDAPLERIGTLPETLPLPHLPAFDLHLIAALSGPALTVAALAAIESLLSARVASTLSPVGHYNGDRELVGQGLASIGAGFFGGMPATGAIARTAVNIRSGAQTRLAAVVHALVLIGVVLFAARFVSQIPLAALAGVLLLTAVRMVNVPVAAEVCRASRADALVFWLTALITVSFDLIIAVGIGIVATAFFALRTLSAQSTTTREELPGTAQPGDERIALFRLDGALFFGVGDRLLTELADIEDVSVVILRMSQIRMLDSTGARVITELVTTLERRGITVLVKGIQARHERLTRTGGLSAALRHPNHLFDDLDAAVAHARSHIEREDRAG